MAARLQAATSSGKPVLLRVDYDAGHGIGSTKTQREESLPMNGFRRYGNLVWRIFSHRRVNSGLCISLAKLTYLLADSVCSKAW